MQTIIVTVRIPWENEDGPAEEFIATITDPTVEVRTRFYSLSGPATFTVEETP